MARHVGKKLTVQEIKAADAGKYSNGAGLWIHKRSQTAGQWFLRVTVHGRRREMGLGGWPATSLKEAREAADEQRAFVRKGMDPITVRNQARREAQRNLHLLKDIAADCFESRKAELREDGKSGRWFSPLELHVLPKLGRVPVAEIDQIDIRNILAPIWHSKASTAEKAIQRLGICIKHAAALGLDVDLQVVDKARALLGTSRHEVTHIPSMNWQEVPAFYASLDEGSVTHLALRLLILTGLRSKPVRFCRLDQIEGHVWTVPAELMKGRKGKSKDFRLPLSSEAQSAIKQASAFLRDGFLFPSVRKGVISDATMSRYMQRLGLEPRPHGFRTSFKTWCEEAAEARWEVSETVLSHTVGGKVERSYNRTDYLEPRRVLMERWADHVTGGNRRSGKVGGDVRPT